MIDRDPSASEPVVEILNLSRTFQRKEALHDVSLVIPRGGVFGLIGVNGAGKTTLIKHLIGAYYAQTGSVRVFGLDPTVHHVEVLGRIGYVSDERDLTDWMRVDQIINFTRTFFPTWDDGYAKELLELFKLDPKQRVRNLSRGEAARVALLLALAHRPDVLLLDEPSSGLDPVVRRDILTAIVRTVADEGRTVIFSSHLLDEIERLADRVAMIHHGRVVLNDRLDAIRDSFHRVTLRFATPFSTAPDFPGALDHQGHGTLWTYTCHGDLDGLTAAAKSLKAEIVENTPLSLDDIFVSTVAQPVS
jgi:ABC-2 type transport system ATP-binding protein